jgi:hypothetical protein
MLKSISALIVVCAGVNLSSAGAQALNGGPKVAPPDGSSVERLGDSMVVNGRPVAIDHVTTSRLPADVLRHYRKALNADSSGRIIENKVADDHVLARKIGDHFVTVRVRATPDGASDVWVMTTPSSRRRQAGNCHRTLRCQQGRRSSPVSKPLMAGAVRTPSSQRPIQLCPPRRIS